MTRPRPPAAAAESSACWRGNAVDLTSIRDRRQFFKFYDIVLESFEKNELLKAKFCILVQQLVWVHRLDTIDC